MRLTRHFMYKRIASAFENPISGKILGISELDDIGFLIDKNRSEITTTTYPEIDMQNLPFEEDTFDYVVSDQVIEHVENPIKAVQESHRILKEGGIAIHTTCFINQYHPSPKDFWRFSPDALRFLCRDFREIIQCEGWGNKVTVLLCFLGDRFRAMEIPEKKFSVRNLIARFNQKRYPITTWIIAKK